jgi:Domain of unknown function (DUF4143)
VLGADDDRFSVLATTVRRYLDLLTGALVVRPLPAWFENLSKRQVRSAKVYSADTGLLHTLLAIETSSPGRDLDGHSKVGIRGRASYSVRSSFGPARARRSASSGPRTQRS